MILYHETISTPLGKMELLANDDGICLLEFSRDESKHPGIDKIKKHFDAEIENTENSHIKTLKKELIEYFKGRLIEFKVPIVLTGSSFQNKVWEELIKIPYAETRSYKEQSIAVGNVKAIRAVATANGANKIAIVIPCHRIIGSDRSMTGYAGGIRKKMFLLNLERENAGPKDLFSAID